MLMRATEALEQVKTKPAAATNETLPKPEEFLSQLPGGYAPAETELKFDDEECEPVDILDIRFRDVPYDYDDINELLVKILEKNNYTRTDSVRTRMLRNVYHRFIHKDTQEKIVLFPVVKDRNEAVDSVDYHMFAFEGSLRWHKESREVCDKIIIPVFCSLISHYRLITMDLRNNITLYHDSKSTIASQISEYGMAACAAAYAQVRKDFGYDTNRAPLPNFLERLSYVQSACESNFYNIGFQENHLNHQSFYNFKDSGAYVVAYAEMFIENVNLTLTFALDIDTKKEEYHQLLFARRKPAAEEAAPVTRPRP